MWFFFSSRRRHTRCSRDWSSDVCSSDLVGAVADPGTTFANKNGWLSVDNTNGPGENDNGLWLVNSVGVVMVQHQQVLMAVFTQHGDSFEDGVELVESLAKAITRAVVATD